MNAQKIYQKRIEEAAKESVLGEASPLVSDYANDYEIEYAYERAQEIFIAGATEAVLKLNLL